MLLLGAGLGLIRRRTRILDAASDGPARSDNQKDPTNPRLPSG